MRHEQFDRLVRLLSGGATRRGALGVLAGIAGLSVAEVDAERRTRRQRRQRAARRRDRSRLTAQQRRRPGPAQRLEIRVEDCPDNPPDNILILHALGYPGYWWEDTHLTVAVQAHPNASASHVAAARHAIVTWNDVLHDAGDLSVITLEDVTDTLHPDHKANIVLHYVPRAGGTVFGGYAICGEHKCNNVIVRSDLPKPLDREQYTPEYLFWVTLHELGHALGLGHAEPLEETNDLMGYGWPPLEPVLSECDLLGLRHVFAWAIEGEQPYPPTLPSISCRHLCPQPED